VIKCVRFRRKILKARIEDGSDGVFEHSDFGVDEFEDGDMYDNSQCLLEHIQSHI